MDGLEFGLGEGARREPERHPEKRVPDGEECDKPDAVIGTQAECDEPDRADDDRLDRGKQAEGDRIAARRSRRDIGRVICRSSVPLVRSRSIAIEVIRNITMNGKRPQSGTPISRKIPGAPANTYFRRREGRRARRGEARRCGGRDGSARALAARSPR